MMAFTDRFFKMCDVDQLILNNYNNLYFLSVYAFIFSEVQRVFTVFLFKMIMKDAFCYWFITMNGGI